VMLVTSLRMRRGSRKGFQKMVARIDSNTFTVAARSVQLHKGAILKKISLIDCMALYFSGIKRFRERVEATTYSLVLVVILRILTSDLPARHHVTSPTTNNFALTLQCNDKKQTLFTEWHVEY
jgi:hypothetical protein